MKVFYLHLHQDDFTKSGTEWTSGLVDLYDNASSVSTMATPSYTNFTTTKSAGYGDDLLGDNTWTGLDYEIATPATPTTTGNVYGGRYIDESGRIDLISHHIDIGNAPGDGDITPILSIYHIDDSSMVFPEEWATQENVLQNYPIMLVNAYRYATFKIHFDTELDVSSIDFDMYIRVHIDDPVQVPFYRQTRNVLDKFPEWMEMREYSATPVDYSGQFTATPSSLGGQVVNAVAGEWLNDIQSELSWLRLQKFITTADLRQAAWVYFAVSVPEYVYKVTGDGTELSHTSGIKEFYELSVSDDGFFWDEEKKSVYTIKNYDSLVINYVEYSTRPQQVWNWFDEFGLTVDLQRLYLEENETFRNRILDVYRNKPGVGMDAFKLALRREFNLWNVMDSATPHWDHQGATPEVVEIEDMYRLSEFFTADGLATDRFRDLVNELADLYPTTWGFFKWDESLWDPGGFDERGALYGQGYDVVPYEFDSSPNLPEDYRQAGVGDGDDVYIHRPDAITGPREFEATLKMRGRHKTTRTEYPTITVDGLLYGTADRTFYNNPVVNPWITIKVTQDGATPSVIYTEFQAELKSDVDVDVPTPTEASYFIFQIFNEGITQPGLTWFDDAGNTYPEESATPFIIFDDTVTDIELCFGRWNATHATPFWYDMPTNDVDMWVSTDSATVVSSLSASPSGCLSPSLELGWMIVLQSNETSSAVGTWSSEPQKFQLTLNGLLPNITEQDFTLPTPTVLWDQYLEAPPNKKYVVELTSGNFDELNPSQEQYGGWTLDVNGEPLFIDDPLLIVNGINTWADGKLEFDEGSTTEFTWFSGTSATPAYPYLAPIWELFENSMTSNVYGVVDENGPWRNGVPSVAGNSNFNLSTMSVTRADFGIPESDNYVPTWVGVLSNNEQVIAWVDSNTVNPVDDDPSLDFTYPPDAVVEIYDDTFMTYSFAPFVVRARLRPGVTPQWFPYLNSGWFYDQYDEYYAYANSATEQATVNSRVLEGVARQGAPIIIKTEQSTPHDYRQVAFWDDDADDYTLENTQVLSGTGTDELYLAYEDVYDVSVTDITTGEAVASDVFTSSNILPTVLDTDWDHQYEVSYRVRYSFYADNDYIHTDNTQRTQITFDTDGVPTGATPAKITYETSRFDPATPADVPLNTFYTTLDEGFIFISHNEYTLTKVEVRLSPSKVVADGVDYLLVTLRSLDEYSNPKPNQSFHLETDYGNFDDSMASPGTSLDLITDEDGFAVATLTSWPDTITLSGTITITGGVSASVDFQIEKQPKEYYKLTAAPTVDSLAADGESGIAVYGRLQDTEFNPVSNAVIAYRRGRSMYEVFNQPRSLNPGGPPALPPWPDTGMVITDSDGEFVIGPFVTATPNSPGYWFLAAESWKDATPATPAWETTGDVVFWYEYPDSQFGVNAFNELPLQPVQHEIPAEDIQEQATINSFPVTYDDATPYADSTPSTINWEPPGWYAINKYKQYQMGLLGNTRGAIEYSSLDDIHPSHRDY